MNNSVNNSNTGESYCHFKSCGKDQNKSNTLCENCGMDLFLYGERISTGPIPPSPPPPPPPGPHYEDDDTSPPPQPPPKKKKALKIVLGIIGAPILLFFVLGVLAAIFDDPNPVPYNPENTTAESATESSETENTTAKSTPESSVTETVTKKTESDTVIPDFLQFASGYASQKGYEYKEGTGLKHIYYLIDEDACSVVLDEYVALLSSDYAYKLINEAQYTKWYGFQFVGNGTIGKFQSTIQGVKYDNNSVSVQILQYTNGKYEMKLTISELIDIVKTDKRTSYSQ